MHPIRPLLLLALVLSLGAGEGLAVLLKLDDLTGTHPRFQKVDDFLAAEGLKVNSTQDRYLSVLGGSFLFAAEKGVDVHLAQVRFTNSQQPQFFCEER